MKLIRTSKFSKQSKKLIKNDNYLRSKLEEVLNKISNGPFDESLFTHKLKGDLKESYSSRLNYELRIIFKFEEYEKEECILLLAIGTHDEVY